MSLMLKMHRGSEVDDVTLPFAQNLLLYLSAETKWIGLRQNPPRGLFVGKKHFHRLTLMKVDTWLL
jgi:hypothetical protein